MYVASNAKNGQGWAAHASDPLTYIRLTLSSLVARYLAITQRAYAMHAHIAHLPYMIISICLLALSGGVVRCGWWLWSHASVSENGGVSK